MYHILHSKKLVQLLYVSLPWSTILHKLISNNVAQIKYRTQFWKRNVELKFLVILNFEWFSGHFVTSVTATTVALSGKNFESLFANKNSVVLNKVTMV